MTQLTAPPPDEDIRLRFARNAACFEGVGKHLPSPRSPQTAQLFGTHTARLSRVVE